MVAGKMKIIKVGGDYIKVDPQPCEPGYVWGQRWHRNEQRWGLQCMLFKADYFVLINESELPEKLSTLEVDK